MDWHRLGLLGLGLAAAICALAPARSARADEVSAQQEQKRAPLREVYVKAKQREREALDKRQAVVDRMTQMLAVGTQNFADTGRSRAAAEAKLADKQQELRRAERDLDVALGSHGRDAADPAVKAAQAKRDAVAAELAALQKQVDALRQAELGKVTIAIDDPIFGQLRDADAELARARKDLYRALPPYIAALRPVPPIYLQSVTVFVGGGRMYHAEWRVDNRAPDTVEREITEQLDKAAADVLQALAKIEEKREKLRQIRADQLLPMQQYTAQLNRANDDVSYASQMKIIGPAVVEMVGVIVEVALSGGASTVQRFTTSQAQDLAFRAGSHVVEALEKKAANKVLTAAEAKVVAEIEKKAEEKTLDQFLSLGTTAVAKFDADGLMNNEAKHLADNLGFADNRAAIEVVVSDAAEQLIQRSTKAASIAVIDVTKTLLPRAAGSAATTLQTLGTMDKLEGALGGELAGNLLAVGITSAKALVAHHYENMENEARLRLAEAMAGHAMVYHRYYLALRADQALQKQEKELREIEQQIMAYRLATAGPRVLVEEVNRGNNDPGEELTFRLRFSSGIDKPPQVRIAGLAIDMKPQDVGADGRSAYWEGKLPVKKLPNNISEGVLDVSLGDGSRPYPDLDSEPASAAQFDVPDDLAKAFGARDEWIEFQRGADRNHRIVFKPNTDQKPVPWISHSTCDKINCDCGAVDGYATKICLATEKSLKDDCQKRGQTLGSCGVAGPNAYPRPLVSIKPPEPPRAPPIRPIFPPAPPR